MMGSLQSPIGGIWAVHLGPLGEADNAGLGLECSFVSEDVFFSLRKTMLLKSLLDSGSSLIGFSQTGIKQTLGSLALFLSSYTHLFNTLIECLPYTYIVPEVVIQYMFLIILCDKSVLF